MASATFAQRDDESSVGYHAVYRKMIDAYRRPAAKE